MITLLHLAKDAYIYGSLDNFSALKFENYLQQLKRMVRGKKSPLIQVVDRIAENLEFNIDINKTSKKINIKYPIIAFI